MRIVCFADLHIGVTTYGKIDPITNLNTRVIDAIRSLDEMIDYAITNEIKVMIAAGDMYKNGFPSSTLMTEFNRRIRKALDAGITVLMLDGNHDVDRIETKKSPMIVYDDLRIDNVIHTRFHKEVKLTVDGETIKFVFLPTYHTANEIEAIVNNTTYEGEPIVYIFHGTVLGAALNDWNVVENEVYVKPSVFDREGVAAVVMGHLHKHQVVHDRPLVFYTGSLQRIDFSEEHQRKGFVVLNVKPDNTVTYDFIEIESQRFCTVDVNLIGQDGNETDLIIERLRDKADDVKNAIVRIRVDLNQDQTIHDVRVYEHAYQLGATYVLDIQKRYQRSTRVRMEGLMGEINEYKILELYYKGRENADRLIEVGRRIIDHAKEAGRI